MISPRTCPICGKLLAPADAENSPCFPFCSTRCQQIDLYRWSEGKYAIVEPLNPEDMPASAEFRDDASDEEA